MSLPLAPGSWTLDPAHSVVGFGVKHLGISVLKGRFGSVDATLDVGEDAASSSLRAAIEMSSIDTGNGDRDGHLQSSDFFSVETNPQMTFTSTAIADGGDGDWSVTGDLTLNGVTKSVDLAVSLHGTEDNPFDGSHRAGFEATGRIDRTDFGIDWQVPLANGGIMLGTAIDITLDVQLVAPSAD